LFDPESILGQLNTDASILAGVRPTAFADAQQFVATVQAAAGDEPIYVTGHSLGGALAQDVAAQNPDIVGVTFGALAAGAISGGTNNQNLTNYIDVNDPAYVVISRGTTAP